MPVIDMAEAKRHMLTIASSQLAEDLVNETIEVFDGDHVLAISTIWTALEGIYGIAIAQGVMSKKQVISDFKNNSAVFIEDLPRLVADIRKHGAYSDD